jgi:hypothetical protein
MAVSAIIMILFGEVVLFISALVVDIGEAVGGTTLGIMAHGTVLGGMVRGTTHGGTARGGISQVTIIQLSTRIVRHITTVHTGLLRHFDQQQQGLIQTDGRAATT